MSNVADFLTKISARSALSWPAFWVYFALSLIGTFLGRLETYPQWWERIAAVGLAQVTVFAVIGLGSLIERRIHAPLTRGLLAVVWFALAGLVRGLTVGSVFGLLGLTPDPFIWSRLAGGVGSGLTAFVPMAFLIGEARRSARIRAELLARQQQLALTAERVNSKIDVIEDSAMQKVRTRIVESLAEVGAAGSSEQLERVATDIVRPLSHELAQATPTWQVPQVGSTSNRVRWAGVVDQMASGAPFLPFSTVALITTFSLTSYISQAGPWGAALIVALLLPIGLVVLRGTNELLTRLLPGKVISLRITFTLVAAIAAALVLGTTLSVLARLALDPAGGLEVRLFTSVVLLVPLFGIPLALGRAAVAQLRAGLDDLRVADESLAREVSRLCMHQWSTQRSLARALHGPVQAMIAASSAQVSHGGDPDEIVPQLRDQLSKQLDPHNVRSTDADWRETLRRVQATWQGLCEVRIDIEGQASRLLDGDAIGAEIAMEVVSEAVSNAVRHGKASRVDVTMRGGAGQLDLTIINEGLVPGGGGAGLGTQMLQDCALMWRRETTDSGVSLNVSLSLSEELSTTT